MPRFVCLALCMLALGFLGFGCKRLHPGNGIPVGPEPAAATATPTCSGPAPGSCSYNYNPLLMTDGVYFTVIRSQAEWAAFNTVHGNNNVPPISVDFSAQSLLAWYLHYGIPGYVVSISLNQICASPGNLVVTAKEAFTSTAPIPGMSPMLPGGSGVCRIDSSVKNVTVYCGATTVTLHP